jgi:hypothetical protein
MNNFLSGDKMKKLVALLMVAGLFIGLAIAAEDGAQETRKIKKQDTVPSRRDTQARPGMPAVTARDRAAGLDSQERQRQMLASRAEIHKQAIDELEAFKMIAQEEGAVRTAEAIQKMIDKKNEEYQKSIEAFTRKQRERAEQIRQRTRQPNVTPSEKKVEEAKEAVSPTEPAQ